MDHTPFFSYPRPQLKRDSYLCLNGQWEDGALVPFPLGSVLSGVDGETPSRYAYHRHFEIPEGFIRDKVLLHFMAVDCETAVYVDGKKIGEHTGGYLPFSFDVTEFGAGTHTLQVEVKDDTNCAYPYGKQTLKPGGMWYTPVAGIWGSVWIESVPKDYIRKVTFTPTLTAVQIEITGGTGSYRMQVFDRQDPQEGSCIIDRTYEDKSFTLEIPEPKCWSPEEPNLYGVKITSGEDVITSYFALREISMKENGGYRRICLNGKPYFFHGVLDQGYFPEGIFLPNNEEGYEKDILKMKELGINTLRKHIKVEPECFYEACDRLGMIVFQDMVNNGKYSFFKDTALPTVFHGRIDDRGRHKNKKIRQIFLDHAKETIGLLYNHPCICYYTIFNEGWGQFDSDRVYAMVKEWDQTRIIDSTSGWFKQNQSDVESIHCYFKPIRPVTSDKPIVVSEMGGYSVRIPDHYFNKTDNYGYKTFENTNDLTCAIIRLYEEEVIPYIAKGLCGSIYTQLSDVEDETNGFYTYDRRVCKVDKEKMKALSHKLVIGA